MQLYRDKPSSKGVENVLKRAKQLVNIEWMPTNKIPCGYIFKTPTEKKYMDAWLPGYRPQRGMIYSSVRIHEKYVGYNISLETYMTALTNPNSVLYTRPQHGLGRAMYSYYGTVCSEFVSYSCDLPHRVPCASWPTMEGVTEVDTTELETLQLCDIVLNTQTHIAIITDILRDVDGKVCSIQVSESTPPCCCAEYYTPEMFRKFWLEDGFHIYRYEGIHNAAYTPSPYVHLEDDPWLEVPPVNTAFMTDYGNKANYLLGENVEFTIFEEDWETVEVTGPDSAVTVLPIEGSLVVFTAKEPGYYTAVCRKGGETSLPLEFFMVGVDVRTEKPVYPAGEAVRVVFENAISEDTFFLAQINDAKDFFKGSQFLTPDEIAAGQVDVTIQLVPGQYYAVIMAHGKYGNYTARSVEFTVE